MRKGKGKLIAMNKKVSIPKKVFSSLILLAFIILAGANTQNPDLLNYQSEYYASNTISEGAWLKYFLEHFFSEMNFSFSLYRLLLYTFGLTIIYNASKKLIGESLLFLFLLLLFPLTIYSVQTDNFMCSAFLILGVSYLTEDNKKGNITSLICILLAGGFHVIAYLYLPILFLKNLNKRIFKRLVFGTFVVCCIILALSPSLIQHLSDYLIYYFSENNDNRANVYLTKSTRFGFIIPWSLQLLGLGLVWYAYKRMLSNNFCSPKKVKIVRLILLINIFAIAFLPIYRINVVTFRLGSNLVPINYMAFIMMIKCENKISMRVFKTFPLIIYALIFSINQITLPYWDSIIIPFFTENWIF